MTLTPQQWDIVETLVASRIALPCHIIGERIRTDAVPDNLVRVQICRIRRTEPEVGQYIETVCGVGYRWAGPRK